MSDYQLTKKRLNAGIWEGTLTGPIGASPTLALRYDDEVESGLTVKPIGDGTWAVLAPVPTKQLNDQVQTFVIVDEISNAILNSFSIFAGDQMTDVLQVEIDLLRAELDILKRAFRKHCVKTT